MANPAGFLIWSGADLGTEEKRILSGISICEMQEIDACSTLEVYLASCSPLQMANHTKLECIHGSGLGQDSDFSSWVINSSNTSFFLFNFKCVHVVNSFWNLTKGTQVCRCSKLSRSYLPSCSLRGEPYHSFILANWKFSSFRKLILRQINKRINPEIGKQGT